MKRSIAVSLVAVAWAPAIAAIVILASCGADVRLGDVIDAAPAQNEAGDAPTPPPPPPPPPPIDGGPDAIAQVGATSGLVMWLDGDRGVTVSTGALVWADQSGHGNDALPPRAVPTVTSAGFNGHAGIAFDSTQLLGVLDNTSLQFGADFTVVIVARSSTPAADYGALFGKSAATFPFPGAAMFVNYPPLSGTRSSTVGAQVDFNTYLESTETGVSDGIAKIFEMQRIGTTLSVRVDSHPPITKTVPVVDLTSPGVDIFIGGHNEVSVVQGLTGAIAEVLAINGTISVSDYAALHAYLSAKYAIP